MESFAVFGGAFLMRPVGGIVIGYIGDVSGRKKALEISIFLMAMATTLMGCLPTYEQVGGGAILALLLVRMAQGLSVGGQLMSSLVFTVEGHPQNKWGLYGATVMAAGNFGTFLGGIVASTLRSSLTEQQLLDWGWRIPFLSGILISFCGIYLKYFCQDDGILPGHSPVATDENENDHESMEVSNEPKGEEIGARSGDDHGSTDVTKGDNPLKLAFSRENRRSLLSSATVPMLWSGGFYLSFVWMAIYMQDLVTPPVPSAFTVNSSSLLLLCLWFPAAGALSDRLGRKLVMTVGAMAFGLLGPFMIFKIEGTGGGDSWVPAFVSQTVLSISLALFGAPMCAWLVESFEPKARLTSVSIGYNVAQALAGGMSPFIATLCVDQIGIRSPGLILFVLSAVSLTGLWLIAPSQQHVPIPKESALEEDDEVLSLELREIS